MTEDSRARIREILNNLPGYGHLPDEALTVTRLGGLTNLVFRVEAEGPEPVVVRLAGAGTESYIDRRAELVNAGVAARAGIAPEVLWADAAQGVMVTRCLPGIVTMTPAEFAARPGAVTRAGLSLARLHGTDERFDGQFELFAMINGYLEVLAGTDVTPPEGYHEVVAAAGPVRAALDAHPVALAPCHCDPLCENFLDDGETMWIVDYEYGGMNDPLWDLGDLSVEGQFTPAMEAEMLGAYFGRAPTAAETGRVVIYKAMCDLLWTLWGLIQVAEGNPAEDFRSYAETRFARCKALMSAPEFAAHVEAVAAG